jgi:hypothetical protein
MNFQTPISFVTHFPCFGGFASDLTCCPESFPSYKCNNPSRLRGGIAGQDAAPPLRLRIGDDPEEHLGVVPRRGQVTDRLARSQDGIADVLPAAAQV